MFFIIVSLPATAAPEREVAAGGDAEGVLHPVGVEAEHAPGHQRRGVGGEGGVVPAALPDPGDGELAEAHLDLVGQHDPEDEVAPGEALPLAEGARGRDDVARVRRVGLPVDVVVVHRPDHEGVQEGRVDRLGLHARDPDGALGARALLRDILLDDLQSCVRRRRRRNRGSRRGSAWRRRWRRG